MECVFWGLVSEELPFRNMPCLPNGQPSQSQKILLTNIQLSRETNCKYHSVLACKPFSGEQVSLIFVLKQLHMKLGPYCISIGNNM